MTKTGKTNKPSTVFLWGTLGPVAIFFVVLFLYIFTIHNNSRISDIYHSFVAEFDNFFVSYVTVAMTAILALLPFFLLFLLRQRVAKIVFVLGIMIGFILMSGFSFLIGEVFRSR